MELDVGRIRELSKSGRHREALAAAEALAVALPHNRDALYLVAANLRCLNRIPEALEALQRLEQHHPHFSLLHQERGHCYVTLRDAPRAVESFMRAVNINPALMASWIGLERLYGVAGERVNAAIAAEHIATLKHLPPEVVRAGNLFSDGDLAAAETNLRVYLRAGGRHCEALRLLARIEHQRDMLDDAERLLEEALRLAANYRAARLDYARVLIDRQNICRHENRSITC
jgi:tetratricopeptide (TPR) repeat protein